MKSIRISFTTIALIILLLCSGIAYIANAQTPTERFNAVEAARETARETERTTTTTERQANVAEVRETRRTAIMERVSERMATISDRFTNRALAYVERLEGIALRMGTFLNSRTTEGDHVNEALRRLDEAQTTLLAVRESLDTTSLMLDDSVEQREAATALKVHHQEVRNALTEVKNQLRAVMTTYSSRSNS